MAGAEQGPVSHRKVGLRLWTAAAVLVAAVVTGAAVAGATYGNAVSRYVFALRYGGQQTSDPDSGCPAAPAGRPFADGTYDAFIVFAPSRDDLVRLESYGFSNAWAELWISWIWEDGRLHSVLSRVDSAAGTPAAGPASVSQSLPALVRDLLLPFETEIAPAGPEPPARYEERLLRRLCGAKAPLRSLFVEAVPVHRLISDTDGFTQLGLFLDPARWAQEAPDSPDALQVTGSGSAGNSPWAEVRHLTRTALAPPRPVFEASSGWQTWSGHLLMVGVGTLLLGGAVALIVRRSPGMASERRVPEPVLYEPVAPLPDPGEVSITLPESDTALRVGADEPAPQSRGSSVAAIIPDDMGMKGMEVGVQEMVDDRGGGLVLQEDGLPLDLLSPFMGAAPGEAPFAVFHGCTTVQDFAVTLVTSFFAASSEPQPIVALRRLDNWFSAMSEGQVRLIIPEIGGFYDAARQSIATYSSVDRGVVYKVVGVTRVGLSVDGAVLYKARVVVTQ